MGPGGRGAEGAGDIGGEAGSAPEGPLLRTALWRAVRLRCPRCGAKGVLASWFRLASACPACGLETDRGEEDHFLGAVLLNFVAAEVALAAAGTAVIVATAPDVPWTGLTVGGVLLAAAMPAAAYPWSRLLYLAVDLRLRPEEA